METRIFAVTSLDEGTRLDKYLTDSLAEAFGLSRVRVQRLIEDGLVTSDGVRLKASYKVERGKQIAVNIPDDILSPPDPNALVMPQNIPLSIIYEDELIVAVDKPAGMVVHPAVGNEQGTLVNALLARYPEIGVVGGENRAGIVHRLDKETSGVILVAKTEPARLDLMRQFAARSVQKRYLALVDGVPNTLTGEIEASIGRDPNKRKEMAVIASNRGGRPALTYFTVLKRYEKHAYLEAFPKTGRTHQIRVHLAFIGHPIVGDRVYGIRRQSIKLGRHFLHAESLSFIAPSTHQPLTLQAPLPPELQAVLIRLDEA